MTEDFRFAIVVQSICGTIAHREQAIESLKAEDPEGRIFASLIRQYEGEITGSRLALAAICGVVHLVDPHVLLRDGPCAAVVAWAKDIYPEGRWAAA